MPSFSAFGYTSSMPDNRDVFLMLSLRADGHGLR